MLAPVRDELRFAGRFAAAVAWTAGMPVLNRARLALSAPTRRADLYDRHKKLWAAGLLRISRVDVDASPLPPPARGPRLVVANHRSALDIPILLSVFGGSILSRADLAAWPVVGWAAREAGTIFVDRASGQSSVAAIRLIRGRLEAGETIILFAEGTTFAGDEVRPFQRGAFAALRGLDVEVVPVGIAHLPGTEFIEDDFVLHARAAIGRRCSRVVVRIGAPRHPTQGSRELADELRAAVAELVGEARRSLGDRR